MPRAGRSERSRTSASESESGRLPLAGPLAQLSTGCRNLGWIPHVRALRRGGYGLDEIGQAVCSRFGDEGAGLYLKFAGFSINEVGNFFEIRRGAPLQRVASLLDVFGTHEVGTFLKDVHHKSAHEVASILRGAGCKPEDVGEFLRSGFNLGEDAAERLA